MARKHRPTFFSVYHLGRWHRGHVSPNCLMVAPHSVQEYNSPCDGFEAPGSPPISVSLDVRRRFEPRRYGFLAHRPIVGGVAHFAFSYEPPLGQKTRREYFTCCASRRLVTLHHANTTRFGFPLWAGDPLGALGTSWPCRPDVSLLAFVALFARRALRSLRPLCTCLTLDAGNALNALRALGAGRALHAHISFRSCRSGIRTASCQKQ